MSSTRGSGYSGPIPCLHCPRTFTSQRGCSLHTRRAHPIEYSQSAKPADRTRARWSNEELRRVAEAEVELTKASVPFINQALQKLFPERTCESIKSMSKTKKGYREMVQTILASEESDRVPPLPTDPEAPVRDLSVDLKAADEPQDEDATPHRGIGRRKAGKVRSHSKM